MLFVLLVLLDMLFVLILVLFVDIIGAGSVDIPFTLITLLL
jgi:hypothetical protein